MKAFQPLQPTVAGGGKGFCPSWFSGALFFFFHTNVLFIWLCKGDVPSFLSLCVFLPPAAHTWAGLWLLPLLLGWAESSQRSRGPAMRGLPRSSERCPGENREKLSLKIKQKRARAYFLQATLGIPKLWGSCWNDSVERAQDLCSVLHVCIHLFVLAKWQCPSLQPVLDTKEGRESGCLAAGEGRSRGLSPLCCCRSRMTPLSAVKLSCPGRTDCKVPLVNVEEMFIWSFMLVL